MSNLVNVCNLKVYSVPALTTRTFQIKAAADDAGKVRWLKISGAGGDIVLTIKYISATSGDDTYYIFGEVPAAPPYEFGFEPWEDAAESTLKGIMVDEDDYIEIVITNQALFAAEDVKISFFFINATLTEI
jgi:hypothetical protein